MNVNTKGGGLQVDHRLIGGDLGSCPPGNFEKTRHFGYIQGGLQTPKKNPGYGPANLTILICLIGWINSGSCVRRYSPFSMRNMLI